MAKTGVPLIYKKLDFSLLSVPGFRFKSNGRICNSKGGKFVVSHIECLNWSAEESAFSS